MPVVDPVMGYDDGAS
jgi:hypothetical protein